MIRKLIKQQYTSAMILPPPNVTGVLHIGHALNISIQDLIVRILRLREKEVLFIPGTDHAGIGTEILVKQKLGNKVINMSNEEILEKIWDWKSIFEVNIKKQIKLLDAAIDWSKYKFTLDDDIKAYVTKAFCKLYSMGLIYKSKAIVNWDIKLQTVISDIETTNKSQKSKMYYIKYFLKDKPEEYIEIATTRPETLFADAAVCINPNDKRYVHLVGHQVLVPLTDRYVFIIPDEQCDINKGSGVVKIDPAHAFLDFDIGKKHNLDMHTIIDKNGIMCGFAIKFMPILKEKDRFTARTLVVEELIKNNLIIKVEDIDNKVPYNERSGEIVEPLLLDQWFFDIPKVASRALQALDNELEIIPENAKKTYIHYLSNPKPWCISRQLIWGHKIPVWYYDNDEKYIVAESQEEAEAKTKCKVRQENGVLDTWFSSAMWPIVNTLDQKSLYPNDILITGRDLVFFWVAKMVLMGLTLTGQVPFKKVYCHGLVYDNKGQKMSKSKGNVVDPLELFEKYCVDTTRFALLQNSIPGHDIKFSDHHMLKSQKFITKLKNGIKYSQRFVSQKTLQDIYKNSAIHNPLNRWIIEKTNHFVANIFKAIDNFEIHKASNQIYDFVWDTYCNKYIEASKSIKDDEELKQAFSYATHLLIKILHAFCPSIGSECWNECKFIWDINEKVYLLQVDNINYCDDLFKSISHIRSVLKILQKIDKTPNVFLLENNNDYQKLLHQMTNLPLKSGSDKPSHTMEIPCGEYKIYYEYEAKNSQNLVILRDYITNHISKLEQRHILLIHDLHNQKFIDSANPDLVQAKKDEMHISKQDIEVYTKIIEAVDKILIKNK